MPKLDLLPVLLLLLLPLIQPSAQQAAVCHEPGQCQGITVGGGGADSFNECLKMCQENDNCNWLTYNAVSRNCVEFFDCASIDAGASCATGCHSAERSCAERAPTCAAAGFCHGQFVEAAFTWSSYDCKKLCDATPRCAWLSWFAASGECLLTEDCAEVDASCGADCLSWERECQMQATFNTLFVAGGNGGSAVEAIDLSGRNLTCRSPSTFPIFMGSVGTFIDGRALICGGYGDTDACFAYAPGNDSWATAGAMLTGRDGAAAVRLSETEWWLSGGVTAGATSEVYTAGQGFSVYADLPEARYHHNMVRVDDNRVMLVGGGGEGSAKAWMFDVAAGAWTALPDLARPRARAYAGLVKRADGALEVVVAGGEFERSSEVFSVAEGAWRAGPDIPVGEEVELLGGASVQVGDGFLMVGGYIYGMMQRWQDEIYSFDVVNDEWVVLDQRLGSARYDTAAFLVPDDLVECLV